MDGDLVHRRAARWRRTDRPVVAGGGRPRRPAVGGGGGPPREPLRLPPGQLVPDRHRGRGGPPPTRAGPIDSTPSIVPRAGGQSTVLVGSGNDADPEHRWVPGLRPVGCPAVVHPGGQPAHRTAPRPVACRPAWPSARSSRADRTPSPARSARSPMPSTPPPGPRSPDGRSSTPTAPTPPRPWPTCTAPGRPRSSSAGTRRRAAGAGQTLHRRRPPPDPHRPGEPDLPGRHQPGRRLVPGGGRIPGRRGHRHRGRHRRLLPRRLGHRHGEGLRHPLPAAVVGHDSTASTFSSPALSDVLGNGSLQVVEGTDQGAGESGSVWVLERRHRARRSGGQTDISRVIGSVVTADLTGARLRRRHRAHHRRHPGPRRPDRRTRSPTSARTSASRTRPWSPTTPTGRSGSPWPATPASAGLRPGSARSTTTRSPVRTAPRPSGPARGRCSITIPS